MIERSIKFTSILLGLCLAAAGLCAAAAGDSPAARGEVKLGISRVSKPPGAASRGERVEIVGRVRNRGDRRVGARLKLIVPRREGASSGTRLRRKRLKRVQAGGGKRFRIGFRVGESLLPAAGEPEATHRLAVCVRGHRWRGRWRCRQTTGTLTVPNPLPPGYERGATSIGDPLYPQVGNGGYDVRGYEIELNYEPSSNRFLTGTRTTITAVATIDLGELSLDFQDLDVSSVEVNREPAGFVQTVARPALPDSATELRKLVINPPDGIDSGAAFTVEISYSGRPRKLIGLDDAPTGWVRSCNEGRDPPCDGAIVVNEPNGAQTWFPANDHPSDKATVETAITAPSPYTALGVGELESRRGNGDGTTTWSWSEDDPTATYLTTATTGKFFFDETSVTIEPGGRILPSYEAVDRTAGPGRRSTFEAALDRTGSILGFLTGRYGSSYPFGSTGAIADDVAGLGYALEVQTKPTFSSISFTDGLMAHELAHQWFGNSVSPATWLETWHSEGWAQWSQLRWEFETGNSDESPAEILDATLARTGSIWDTPPATLLGDPARQFDGFAVYTRPAMMLEAYRQIVGEARFTELAQTLASRHGYSTLTTARFIALAREISDLRGADASRLDRFFQQWLYGIDRPTLSPEDF